MRGERRERRRGWEEGEVEEADVGSSGDVWGAREMKRDKGRGEKRDEEKRGRGEMRDDEGGLVFEV